MGEAPAVVSPVKIGIVGCGRWGPNHIRAFQQLEEAAVVACCDPDGAALARSVSAFHINGYDDISKMVGREDLDAVVIAAPVVAHSALTLYALDNGLDVLCEKPLDTSAAAAEAMDSCAKKNRRILMVGHVFLYNDGIRALKRACEEELGGITYAYSRRTSLGPVRYDVGALADLATHDISIINYLMGEWTPKVAGCFRGFVAGNEREDVAFATLRYRWSKFAHLHVSWIDPVKVRQIVVVGEERMAVWDDLDPRNPLAICDKKLEVTKEKFELGSLAAFKMKERHGGVTMPAVSAAEPLKNQARAFVEAVRTREAPLSDGQTGVEVARTLEALMAST